MEEYTDNKEERLDDLLLDLSGMTASEAPSWLLDLAESLIDAGWSK